MLGSLPPATSAIYPARSYFVTSYAPGRVADRDKAVAQVIAKGFPQFAAIIEGICAALKLQPEQVSVYLYAKEYAYGPAARTYAAQIAIRYGATSKNVGLLFGLGDAQSERIANAAAQELGKEALKQTGKQVAQQTAMQAGTTAAGAVPYGAVAAAVVGLVVDYKAVLGSEEGKVNAGFAVTGAGAAALAIPFAGLALAIGAAAYTVIKFRQAKKEAKKEKHRWAEYVKMMTSMAGLAVAEAKKLIPVAVNKGIGFPKKSTKAFVDRLMKHYKMLVKTVRLDLQIKKPKPAYTSIERAPWDRNDSLALFLQLARDMSALEGLLAALPGVAAFDMEAEVKTLTQMIVDRAPACPYQTAATLAMQAVKAYGQPMPQELKEKVANSVATSVGGKTYKEITGATVAGGGALAVGALVVGGVLAAAMAKA